MTAELWIHEVK